MALTTAAQPGYNYVIPWSTEGNASTRFKIRKTDKTFHLITAETGGLWTEKSSYTFVGGAPLGRGPCLVGGNIGDPNLATLAQIAPVELRVNPSGFVLVVR